MQNVQGVIGHLNQHQNYPATKEELVAECDSLSDFSEEDKKEFSEKLLGQTYNSAEEVIKVLGLQAA